MFLAPLITEQMTPGTVFRASAKYVAPENSEARAMEIVGGSFHEFPISSRIFTNFPSDEN
jgi:hypothetical protein